MAHSLFTRRVARLAMAPAGASCAITTTSLLLGGAESRASNRIASRSIESAAASRLWQRRLFSTTEGAAAKPINSAAASTQKAMPSATANVTIDEVKPAAEAFSAMAWYEKHLNARPVITKMFTGSILWGVGDAVAQIVPRMALPAEQKAQLPPFQYDYPRTGRAVFFGFAIHAPASHVHFNFLEWMTIKTGISGYSIPVFKTIMEQFVYWSWVSNSLYHGAMGAMQGQNLDQIYHRIADVLWETQKAQWVFWIPIQLLNFQFVPVRHQLNVVLLTSIVWTALLSAWYPPMEEGADDSAAVVGTDEAAKKEDKKEL